MEYTLLFFDTETTGNREEDRLCQIAYKIGNQTVSELFNPGRPISFEAMAVHHITEKMIAGKPLFQGSQAHTFLNEKAQDPKTVFVAHNAPFDLGMIKHEGITPASAICTLKVVRALDKDSEFSSYKLQYLRYHLGLEIDAIAHDALGDVLVLEKIYEYLEQKMQQNKGVDRDEAIRIMIEISALPSLLKHITFGKHKGKTVAEVAKEDRSYLEWLYNEKRKNPTDEADWLYTLEQFLK